MSRTKLTKCMLLTLASILAWVPQSAAQSPSHLILDSHSIFNKFEDVYGRWRDSITSLPRPSRPHIRETIYPRLNGYFRDLVAELRRNRLLYISRPLDVIQHISPTFVMASGFSGPDLLTYGSKSDSPSYLCPDGICKYKGQVFVHLSRASVANAIGPAWLKYEGLQTYTTSMGSPETIPRFSEVGLESYPTVDKIRREITNFHPSEEEKSRYYDPIIRSYNEKIRVYYIKELHLDTGYLAQAANVASQMIVYQMPTLQVNYNGWRVLTVPDSMLNSLPKMIGKVKAEASALSRDVSKIGNSQNQRLEVFSNYVQAWIQLGQTGNCSSLYPSFRITGFGDDAIEYITNNYEPWCTLRHMTRYKIPQLGITSNSQRPVPLVPDWWAKYGEMGR